jgi:hypothetical protein
VSPDVREALESAQTVGGGSQRQRSFETVRAIVYAVVESLDSDMTIGDLTEELCIGSAQQRRA